PALLGQLNAASGAFDEGDAEGILQQLDLLADRLRTDQQLLGGAPEVHVPRDGVEDARRVERGVARRPHRGFRRSWLPWPSGPTASVPMRAMVARETGIAGALLVERFAATRLIRRLR